MANLAQRLFFLLIVRPVVFVFLGVSVRNWERMPVQGPAILAANHNSHLDTVVLMSLFPIRMLPLLRPLAAADYFLKTGWLAWFSRTIIHIIPIDRKGRASGTDIFAEASEALKSGDILILFPEGTRGLPERMAGFKKGIAHLVERHPDLPVVPIFMRGLGKSLPKGSWLPVPFFCDLFVGEALGWTGDRESFMSAFKARMDDLADQVGTSAPWV